MAFLFGSRGRQKHPAEIARGLKELLGKLGEGSKGGNVSGNGANGKVCGTFCVSLDG